MYGLCFDADRIAWESARKTSLRVDQSVSKRRGCVAGTRGFAFGALDYTKEPIQNVI